MKPWKGPLPQPRISPPQTLGDAVIKNSFIRLRGGQKIPRSFKMALPSTTQVSSSSPKSNEPSNRDEEWPSLQSLTRQTTKQHRETRAAIGLEANVQKETKLAPGLGPHVQNSKIVQDAVPRQSGSRILIHNRNSKDWFYPSKDLNDLFRTETVW
jgi:hypothetical protein